MLCGVFKTSPDFAAFANGVMIHHLATRQLPAARVDSFVRQLWALEDMPKAGALTAMTRV